MLLQQAHHHKANRRNLEYYKPQEGLRIRRHECRTVKDHEHNLGPIFLPKKPRHRPGLPLLYHP